MRYLAAIISAAFVGCAIGLVAAEEPTPTPGARVIWPDLGPPRAGESHAVPTLRAYRPKHGNAEQANYYSASGCGVERWSIKTLTDPGANQVNLTPQQTWISDLVSIAPPIEPTDRVGPTETQTFTLPGVVTFVKLEADSDYHLVVQDPQGNSMIVESTAPSCAQGSRVLPQIEQVRQAVEREWPEGHASGIHVPVIVTGVGFFDRLHGQTGVAPSGIELHPLTGIQFTSGVARIPNLHLADHRGTD